MYSLPNIILPIIGGVLVDKLGPTAMLIIFSILVCGGQSLFALGVTHKTFPMMAAGRLVFGLGGESLEVAQARVTTDWFKGRALGLALALNLSCARLATAVNDNLSPWLESQFNVSVSSWSGVYITLISFMCMMVTVFLNRPSSRIKAGVPIDYHPSHHTTRPYISNMDSDSDPSETESLIPHNPSVNPNTNIDTNIAHDEQQSIRSLNSRRSHSSRQQQQGEEVEEEGVSFDDGYISEDYEEEDDTVHCSEMKGLSWRFWVLCLTAILLYGKRRRKSIVII